MNEQALRFRVGVFVLAALLLLAVLITLFGSFPRLFVRANEYTARFIDAPGIEQGTPVRRSGVRVGEVKRVTLDDESGEVRVQILIEHQYTIRRNEQPTLVHGLLGGDTSIDFVAVRADPDKADHSPIPPGSELTGVRQPTVNTLLAGAADVLPTTQEALNDIRKSAQRYERMAPLIEETTREYRDLARATRDALPELRATNAEIRELARAGRETVPDLRKTNDQLQATLITWQKTGERAKLILDRNEEKINESMDALNESLKRVNNVLNEENQRNLAAGLRNIRSGTENLPAISKNTEELLRESQRTVRKINDSLVKADEVMGNLQQATKPFADRSPAIAKNLDESTTRLNTAL